MRATVDPERACRLINHGPTVLVSAAHAGRRNLMAAAWSMPVEFAPPRIAVVIDRKTFTRELIAATGMLALCVPCRAQADLVWTVGSVSGHDPELQDTDKFRRYGIGWFDGPALGLPCVEGCVAWMEARVIAEPHTEAAYDTFFVEVVSAQADDRVFADGRWSFRDDNTELHTLHHLGAGVFAVPSRTVAAGLLPVRDA
jgi:flavin reductase (DIM6/NTAB) family NADH-FMN oxidoreductase RutF